MGNFLAILGFLVSNKDAIKQAISNIQSLIPDAPGNQKAAAIRTVIGTALNIEAQIEADWPLVAPIFNLVVAEVKGKPAGA